MIFIKEPFMKKEEKHSNKCPICGRTTHKESKYCIFHASAEEKTEDEFKEALKEYIQKIKKEDGDYDFKEFIFIGDIYFKKDLNITIFKNANFENTTFEGNANFENTTFEGNANFWKTTFKKYADFWKTTFKGGANFDNATFEGEAIFANATFDFEVFKMADTYSPSKFEELFDFSLVPTFEGGANFDNVTFKRYADFDDATFKGFADFKDATFERYADFKDATFKKYANFWKTTFEGGANFDNVTFEGRANFDNVTFKRYADFYDATFKKYADFWKTTFKGGANFNNATFEGNADFIIKASGNIITFTNSLFTQGKTLVIKTTDVKNEVVIDFEKVCLENVYLELDLGVGTSINFTDALLRNTKMEKNQIENHILQMEQVYLLLKNNFHSIGQYKDESWAFTKERDMERKSKSFYSLLSKYRKYSLFKKILKQSNLLKRIIVRLKIFSKWLFSKKAIECFNLSVSDFIYQYGENPWRVIRFALIIIFLFAIILNFSGIVNSDRTNLIIEFIKESQGDEYTLRYLGPILGNFLNCLYFSVVTFTTLGYGDFQPAVGLSRLIVSLESIIGAITMALFVYTFARRTGGR
jgi:hypothetical protein